MDNDRVFAPTAQGMPLGTTDRDTTMLVHSRGVTPFLAATPLSETGHPKVFLPNHRATKNAYV